MRNFEFYEFVAVILPGAVVLTGVALAWPNPSGAIRLLDLSIGGLGLGAVLAYATGHLVQAVGNLIENAWWAARGGKPSDWPRSGQRALLTPRQVALVEERVRSMLSQPDFQLGPALPAEEWVAVVRQVYAAVHRAGATGRVDVFNGNYGLSRGLAAGLLSLIPVLALINWPGWGVAALLAGGAAIAVYRMNRFGVRYGRELFVQFITVAQGKQENANA